MNRDITNSSNHHHYTKSDELTISDAFELLALVAHIKWQINAADGQPEYDQ